MTPKTYEAFQESLDLTTPPKDWPDSLRALWFAAKEDWGASHDIAQDIHTSMGSWIHAYLHRWEGDKWNAGYWYRQAGRPFPEYGLEEELKVLVEAHF